MRNLWIVAFCGLLTMKSQAQITQVSLGGNGCPQESTAVTISPDGRQVSLLFDEYRLNVRQKEQQNSQCGVRISVNVPKGKRLLVERIDYRYFSSLPVGSRLMFFTSVIHARPGSVNELMPRYDLRRDSFGDAYGASSGNQIQSHSFFWSAQQLSRLKCGESYDLLVSSIVDLSDQGQMGPTDEALVSVDSLDSSFIQYSLREVPCRK